MATPTPPAGDAPRRTLKTGATTAIPTRRLVSASGQTIDSKAPVNPLKRGATKAIPAARNITKGIPTKKGMTKAIPAVAKAPSAEEIAAARAVEDARLAAEQAEYERQMEEYNKQLEEYNKQVAEQEAAAAKEAAEKAEAERIAAEKAAAEKAEADRIAAEEAAIRAAAEKAAAEAARLAAKAEAEAAVAAAKLAALEAALLAEKAAEASAAALQEAEAAGSKYPKAEPKSEPKPAAKAAPKLSVKPAIAKAKPVSDDGKPSATQLIRKGVKIPAPESHEAPPSTALLRSAAASAQAKAMAKPPATKMLSATAKPLARKKSTATAAPSSKLLNAAEPSSKLLSAKPASKLVSTPSASKLAKQGSRAISPLKKTAAAKAVPAPDAPASDVQNLNPDGVNEELDTTVEMTEEELHARDAYLNALQLDAEATPMWKKPPFIIACLALLALGGGAFYYVYTDNAAKAAYDKNVKETNLLLKQAGEINKAGAETLADVNKKGIQLQCTLADAEKLMGVIVDPFQKDERGVNRFGGAPKGVAQNAGLLLGIMAEKDPAIETMIFKSLEQNAAKIDPDLFSWMIQRLGVAEVKNINSKLKTLSERIAAQPKFKNKPKHLAALWEVMGLRISEKDLPVILELLKDEEMDAQLVSTLAICLDNIVEMTDDPELKAKMGDQIFDSVPAKFRKKVITTLASACSAKALKYYKKRMEDKNNWPTEITFLAYWGNDELVDYVLELYEANKDDKRNSQYALGAVSGTFRQVRDRSSETAAKLMAPLYKSLDSDSSRRQELINKIDPDAADYVGADSPELAKLKEEFEIIESSQKEKIVLAKTLGEMREYPWVVEVLDRLGKDSDGAVVDAVKAAREKIKTNTAEYAARKAKYLRRSKK